MKKLTLCLVLLSSILVTSHATAAVDDKLQTPIKCLSLREEPLGEAVRLISMVSGLPLVCTPQAADTLVTCYFTDVSMEVGLQALCRAHDLWLNISPEGVLIISTLQQHLDSQTVYSTDYVETVTVKYPSVFEVGDTLKGLFRDRIVWERPDDEDYDPYDRLEMAMDRMDLLSARSQFSVENTSTGSSAGTSRNSTVSGSGSSRSSGGSSGGSGRANFSSGDDLEQLQSMADRNAFLNEQLRERMERGAEDSPQQALVYISAMPEINTLLIRSSDREAVLSVKKAIESIDKPRGQVLLKVTILAVTLNDDTTTGVEWLIEAGDFNTGFVETGGNIQSITSNLASYATGVPVFAFVDNDVRVKVSLLEDNENVRQLANPSLLVADNEAANVFIGQNAKFLDQIEPGQVVTTNGVATTTDPTPTFQDRNVGLSLLVTPRVHADRTVTLRIMQERSRPDPNLRPINYGPDLTVQVQDIDQQIVTSTLVVKDESLVVIGGLVQDETIVTDSGIPVLKDIPGLGLLFSEKGQEKIREELIVLIQPYVLAIPGEEHTASANLLEEFNLNFTPPRELLEQQNREKPITNIVPNLSEDLKDSDL